MVDSQAVLQAADHQEAAQRVAREEERAAGVAMFTPVQVISLQVWELIQVVALQVHRAVVQD